MTVDFVCIGVQKAATTWLHRALGDHPGIETSREKELDFFTARYNRGSRWYEAQFAGDSRRVCGEASPSYFTEADAPLRAHRYNPNFRLLCILRDPVERAFSNHLHEVRHGHLPSGTTFEDAIGANPMYVEQGRYATHLSRWLDVFPRKSLLVLVAEEIAADPDVAWRSVLDHLGLPPDEPSKHAAERRHRNIAYRRPGVQAMLRALGDGARAAGLGGAVTTIKRSPLVAPLLAANEVDMRNLVPPMRGETRAALIAEFAPEVAHVAALLGRDVLPWPGYGATSARSVLKAVP